MIFFLMFKQYLTRLSPLLLLLPLKNACKTKIFAPLVISSIHVHLIIYLIPSPPQKKIEICMQKFISIKTYSITSTRLNIHVGSY